MFIFKLNFSSYIYIQKIMIKKKNGFEEENKFNE